MLARFRDAFIVEELSMEPRILAQDTLPEVMHIQYERINGPCNNRYNVTGATALIPAYVFGNRQDFRLSAQRRNRLREAAGPKE